ncbi:hypothetical protein [Kibdelosporangium philippinense]|uniref:hypothetical protein n=1 Tax=Kibdelosporangium philippinense TaxID=211113 RepID=UPI003608D280
MKYPQPVRKDLEREWARPGERIRLALAPECAWWARGSRTGFQVPHPMPGDTPMAVDLDLQPPSASDFAAAGRFDGLGWTDDESIGWWVEAHDPRQDAALIADAMAGCNAQSGLALSDRRVAAIFPERLLVSGHEVRKAARKEKSIVGQALSAANQLGVLLEELVSMGEAGFLVGDGRAASSRRSRFLTGRSFPFAEIIQVISSTDPLCTPSGTNLTMSKDWTAEALRTSASEFRGRGGARPRTAASRGTRALGRLCQDLRLRATWIRRCQQESSRCSWQSGGRRLRGNDSGRGRQGLRSPT